MDHALFFFDESWCSLREKSPDAMDKIGQRSPPGRVRSPWSAESRAWWNSATPSINPRISPSRHWVVVDGGGFFWLLWNKTDVSYYEHIQIYYIMIYMYIHYTLSIIHYTLSIIHYPLHIIQSGGWFGTCEIFFHNIWDNPSHWLMFLYIFQRVETTNQWKNEVDSICGIPVWKQRFLCFCPKLVWLRYCFALNIGRPDGYFLESPIDSIKEFAFEVFPRTIE